MQTGKYTFAVHTAEIIVRKNGVHINNQKLIFLNGETVVVYLYSCFSAQHKEHYISAVGIRTVYYLLGFIGIIVITNEKVIFKITDFYIIHRRFAYFLLIIT